MNDRFQNFIIQAEDLILRSSRLQAFFALPKVRPRIKFVVVDEVHNIDRWGRSHGDLAAFRPAWGLIGAACARVFLNPRKLALTATAPPSLMEHITTGLRLHPDQHEVIRMPLNRSNICYAAAPLRYPITDMRNYEFLVPDPKTLPPSSIVFCDQVQFVVVLAQYLNQRLDPSVRTKDGLIRPYHGQYTDMYRTRTWAAFKAGECRILVATSSAGTVCGIYWIESVIF